MHLATLVPPPAIHAEYRKIAESLLQALERNLMGLAGHPHSKLTQLGGAGVSVHLQPRTKQPPSAEGSEESPWTEKAAGATPPFHPQKT